MAKKRHYSLLDIQIAAGLLNIVKHDHGYSILINGDTAVLVEPVAGTLEIDADPTKPALPEITVVAIAFALDVVNIDYRDRRYQLCGFEVTSWLLPTPTTPNSAEDESSPHPETPPVKTPTPRSRYWRHLAVVATSAVVAGVAYAISQR